MNRDDLSRFSEVRPDASCDRPIKATRRPTAFALLGMAYTWSALFSMGLCALIRPAFDTWGWIMVGILLGFFVPAGLVLLLWFFVIEPRRQGLKLKPVAPGPLFDAEFDH